MHFSAFHPDWKMRDVGNTPAATLTRARRIAMENGVRYAYTGNVHDPEGASTWCHACGELLIERDWYELGRWNLDEQGRCRQLPGGPARGISTRPRQRFGARRIPVRLASV